MSDSILNDSALRQLSQKYKSALLDDSVPFWLRHGWDRQHGGIMTSLDRDGSLLDTDKGIWQQGRFAWLMGKLFNTVEKKPLWIDACLSTVGFIERHAVDPTDGRMWFQVTREGRPIRKRRYAFSEAFAAMAYGEAARATGSAVHRDAAKRAFERFVNHQRDFGKSLAKFTDERPTRGIGIPMITINLCQELRESIGLRDADLWIERSIDDIRRYHVKPDIQCVMETVGPNGEMIEHFDGRTLNPGHAIEGAWFILHEARRRNDQSLAKLGLDMLDWMWKRGWDAQYGGLLYFVGVDGKPVQEYWHDMKFWWPHNETIIATLLAWKMTGDQKYADWHKLVDDWSFTHFADKKQGEWYGYLHRDGRLSTPVKGNLWKGPFHFPRMSLYCWQLASK